eukprot:2283988-Amphidinium_carterae.1
MPAPPCIAAATPAAVPQHPYPRVPAEREDPPHGEQAQHDDSLHLGVDAVLPKSMIEELEMHASNHNDHNDQTDLAKVFYVLRMSTHALHHDTH